MSGALERRVARLESSMVPPELEPLHIRIATGVDRACEREPIEYRGTDGRRVIVSWRSWEGS